jgi:hypothetical protein
MLLLLLLLLLLLMMQRRQLLWAHHVWGGSMKLRVLRDRRMLRWVRQLWVRRLLLLLLLSLLGLLLLSLLLLSLLLLLLWVQDRWIMLLRLRLWLRGRLRLEVVFLIHSPPCLARLPKLLVEVRGVVHMLHNL